MRYFTSTTAYVLYAASLTLCGLVWMSTALAAPNLQINYQGKLTDSSGVAVTDGDYSIAFALYTDPVSGGDIWNETATATVQNGLFSIMLGSSTSFAGVNFNQTLYLGINVEGDGEMSPRKILGTVPAAFEAQRLDGLATSSFLRSDADDTATGLLSFTGTTTFATSTFAIASTTILRIAGQEFSSLLGSGLTISGGALTANISESNLNIAAAPTDGYVLQASSTAAGGFVWQATSSLGFVAGEEVTLAGEDYLSLLGQQITANAIDPDNLSASDFGDFTCNGTTCTVDAGSINASKLAAGIPLTTFLNDAGFIDDLALVSFYDFGDTPAGPEANEVLYQDSGGVISSANFTFNGTTLGLTGTTALLFGGDAQLSRGAANRLDLASSDSFNIVSGALQVAATTVVDSSRRIFSANGTVGAGTLAYSFSADTNTGLYGTGSDVLGFVTNGVERARFDSSGNFGIGSSTPSRRLTIGGSAYIGGTLRATGTVQFDALTNGLLRANSSGVLSSVATSSLGIALSDTTGVLAATRGGTGLSSITQNQLLIGGAGNTWTQIATSSLGLGNGRFLGLTDTINSYNANRILFTDATGVVDSADFAFNDSSDTLTIGGLTLADGLIAFTSPSTTTIPNGEAYAFTIATSSTGVPLFRIDTTGGSAAVNIGSGSGDVFIGGVGSGSDLIFEESSTISGQGTNVITLGVAGDTFNVAPGVAFNIGTTTQNGLFTIASSTSQSLATFAQYGSGDIVSVFDGATEVFSILDGGNVGVGTSTPTSRLSVTGNTYLDGNLRLTGTLLDTTGDAGSNGQVLLSTGVGTNWVATSSLGFLSDISAQNLSDLADVNAASVLGSLLYYNGSTWDDIATSSLGIALGDTTGVLAATRGGTGLSSITQNQLLIGGAGNTWSQVATSSLGLSAAFTNSAQLAALLSDETGTGNVVYSNSPVLTGTIDAVAGDFSSTLTMSGSAANIALGSNWLSGDGDDSDGIQVDSSGNIDFSVNSSRGLRLIPSASNNILRGITDLKIEVADENAGGNGGHLTLEAADAYCPFSCPTQLGYNVYLNPGNGGGGYGSVLITNGNLGIGSTTPSSKLTVAGAGYFGGNLTATGTLAVLGTGTSTFAGGLDIGGALDFNSEYFTDLTGAGLANIAGALSLDINGLTEETTFESGDFLAFYDTTAGVVRKVDFDQLPGAGGGLTSLNGLTAATQSFATGTDTNIGLTITSSGSTHTFTPTWSGTLAATRGGTGLSSITQNQLLIGGAGNTWTQIATSSLGFRESLFTDGGASTYLTSLTDNLGIGTTSPNAKLSVWGDFRVGTSSEFNLLVNTDQNQVLVGEQTQFLVGTSSVTAFDGFVVDLTDFDTPIVANGGNILFRTASGDFSFDTTNGGFDVNTAGGAITLSGGTNPSDSSGDNINLTAGDASGSFTPAGDIVITAGASTDTFTTNTAGAIQLITQADGNGVYGNVSLVQNGGNVGVGTTAPTSKLTIAGNTYIGGNLRATGTVRFDALTSGLLLADASGNLSSIATSSLGIASPFGASINVTELASEDFGSFTCNGTTCTLDTGSVATAQILDDTIDFADINYGNTLSVGSGFGANETFFGSTGIIFEGSSADGFETLLTVANPTADRTLTLQNVTGTIYSTGGTDVSVADGGTGASSLTAGGILFGNGTSAITNSGVLTNGQLLIGDGSGAPTVATLTQGTGITVTNGAGSITIASTLGTDIAAAEIADGDHGFFSYSGGVASLDAGGLTSANLASALTNETGTGNVVFSDAPTFTTNITTPLVTNAGTLALSATGANVITASTNGSERLRITSTGNVGIGTTSPNARLTVAGNINVDDRTSNLSGVFLNQTPLATASTSLRNFFLAGASSTSFTSAAVDNYAIGDGALRNLSTGRYNIGIGEDALQARLGNLTGDGNVGIGYQALQDTTSGTDNIAIGFNALAFNTTGSYNLGLGLDSLGQNSTGGSNVALGASALGSNETGARNVSLGVFANYFNVVGAHNVALGYSALFDNDATGTIAIGYRAADNAVSVDRGIFIGYDIDAFSTTQDDVLNIGNIIFGTGVDGTGTTLSSGNIGIGSTTPSSKLTVAGAGYFGGNLRATGTVQFDALTSGLLRANSSGILSSVATSSLGLAISDTTGTLAVNRGGTGLTTFGGVNTVLYTTAADTLASNSNFTFNGTNLVLGGTTGVSMGGDVLISRGAANRLDVASGDSVNLVSGALQVGATTVVDSSRRIFTANGTVGAGSLAYSFSADTNTGLYGTGSDVLGFVTGGTERARIDSTGNVGVGTTAPVGRLSVSSASLAQTWSLIGSELNISGVTFPTLTALSANRAAFIDSGNDDLRVYEFNGSTWSLVGTELNIAGVGAPALTTLSPNRVAFIDSGNDDLRVYEFNGSTWSLVGTELNISGISFPALTTLSPNRVAFVDSDNEDLRVYEFNGSTWSQVGTEINISGIGFASLTTLSPNRVAFIDSGNDDLRVYEFNGSTWSQVGSELTIATSDVPALTTLSPNRVAFVDANNDDLRVYEFNGSTWSLSGTELNISGISFPALTTLSPNRVAFIDFGNADLRVYQFSSPTFFVGNSQDSPFLAVSDAGYVTAEAMLVNAGLTVNSVATGTNAINGTSSPALVVNGTSIFGDDIFARGNLSIGSTSANSLLTIDGNGYSGAGVFGIRQFLQTQNSVASAVQFGNNFYLQASNTATTTIVGNIMRIEDSTEFGNTVRALEVQADRGINTLGENTALSGFARTFGVRGTTRGDAGGEFEPAGGFFETEGTTQGNAIRGYSGSITTSALLSLFQDTSDFIGTGLLMNFGNAGGTFASTTASNFIRLQNAGTTLFSVNASGTVTIGEVGGTTNLASLQIGFGGICVDDDGSCTASTSGRITATEYNTANSDLAEQYFSNEALEPGEIVYLKGGLSVGRADQEMKEYVIGVVSTAPGLTLGANDVPTTPGESPYPIALTGRVPIKLSNENGPIKKGDQLMLSSIPGVAMKASSTGMVVGIALEDFDESRAYSDTYVSQFGENIIVPEYVPVTEITDPRINDGCYFGGGAAAGEAPCVPLEATTTVGTVDEANRLALEEAKERALRALARERSERAFTPGGQEVSVGQITMFVDLRYRYFDEVTEAKLASLMTGTSTIMGLDGEVEEVSVSLMDRMIDLTSRFFDGVLTLVGLKAETVTTDELCIGNTCVNEAQLIELLNNQAAPTAAPAPSTPPPTGGSGSTPVPQPEPEPAPAPEPTPEPPATTTEPDNATSTPPAPEPEPTPDTGSSTPPPEPPVTAEPVEEENPPAPEPEPTSEPEVAEIPEPAVDEVTTETPEETNP